jgi:hypothetical protein
MFKIYILYLVVYIIVITLCKTLFFRELVHFLTHMGEAFKEEKKKLILVIPPPIYAR